MKHTFSVETLFHFNCGHCKSWWSIGDFNIARFKLLTCPYCNKTEELSEDTEADYPQEIVDLFDKFETLL